MENPKTCDASKLLYLASYVCKNAKSLSILQICYLLAKKSFFSKMLFCNVFWNQGREIDTYKWPGTIKIDMQVVEHVPRLQ